MEAKAYESTRSENERFVVTPEEKNMAVFCHLSAFVGLFIPFGNIIGPLALWLLKRDEMPFVDDQGKESLNFQITMTLASIVAALSIFVLVGILLLPAVLIYWLVATVIAAIRTSEGKVYRYPYTIRFVG